MGVALLLPRAGLKLRGVGGTDEAGDQETCCAVLELLAWPGLVAAPPSLELLTGLLQPLPFSAWGLTR